MIVHDINRKILGFVAHKRVNFIVNHKICERENISSLFKKHPVPKTRNDMYASSSLHHECIDNICAINHITDVRGYNPFNVPMDLVGKYSFHDLLPNVQPAPEKRVFMKYGPSNTFHEIKNNQNVIAMVSKEDLKSLKRNMSLHTLAMIPKNTVRCLPSDHWFEKEHDGFTNPNDIYIVSHEKMGNRKGVTERLEDCLEEEITKKSRSRRNTGSISSKSSGIGSGVGSGIGSGVGTITVYTDASIIDGMMGIGVWCDDVGYDIQKHLYIESADEVSDINRGELSAILFALLKLKSCREDDCVQQSQDVVVMTDSLTSIRLIQGTQYSAKFDVLVKCIQHVVREWKGRVFFKKIKGHSGNVGNDNADFLARYGVLNKIESFLIPYRGAMDTATYTKYIKYANEF